MAKMIRCDSGHVYSAEAHSRCPECARLGIGTDAAQDDADTTTAATSGARPRPTAAGIGIPASWLLGGGAAAAVALAVGFIVLRTPAERPQVPEQRGHAPSASVNAPSVAPRMPDILPGVGQREPGNTAPTLPAPSGVAPRAPPGVGPEAAAPQKSTELIPASALSPQRSGWTAYAYSTTNQNWGEAYKLDSAAQAQERAVVECGGREQSCKIAVWFKGRCGAIARGANLAHAAGLGDTPEAAAQDAISDCNKVQGTECRIIRVGCSH